ncbi:hypothetical protein ACFYRN_35400 [Streptomyces sp. NPDC005227]|uniref:hypothetical protein n=1 Tax=Streptomyces sp. NPDC005227 TaxID=3364707 RepID=UPI0036A7052C
MVAAAKAYLVLDDPQSARAVLDRAEPELGDDDPVLRAHARLTRATVDLYFTGMRGISALLLDAANPVAALDPPLARRMLFAGLEVLVVTGAHVDGTTPEEYARAALASPALRTTHLPTVTDLLLRGFATRIDAGHAPALPLLREALALLGDGGEVTEEGDEVASCRVSVGRCPATFRTSVIVLRMEATPPVIGAVVRAHRMCRCLDVLVSAATPCASSRDTTGEQFGEDRLGTRALTATSLGGPGRSHQRSPRLHRRQRQRRRPRRPRPDRHHLYAVHQRRPR